MVPPGRCGKRPPHLRHSVLHRGRVYSLKISNYMKDFALGATLLAIGFCVLAGTIFGSMAGYASIRGYLQESRGRADLREAEWNRQIAIEEARAANESATLQAEARIKQETANAEAEIIRARGVAEANKIIGEGLKGNDEYLRYLWIQSTKGEQVIYIPTEAGLPVLEAGKRN